MSNRSFQNSKTPSKPQNDATTASSEEVLEGETIEDTPNNAAKTPMLKRVRKYLAKHKVWFAVLGGVAAGAAVMAFQARPDTCAVEAPEEEDPYEISEISYDDLTTPDNEES